jgi:hypothetical protein
MLVSYQVVLYDAFSLFVWHISKDGDGANWSCGDDTRMME